MYPQWEKYKYPVTQAILLVKDFTFAENKGGSLRKEANREEPAPRYYQQLQIKCHIQSHGMFTFDEDEQAAIL